MMSHFSVILTHSELYYKCSISHYITMISTFYAITVKLSVSFSVARYTVIRQVAAPILPTTMRRYHCIARQLSKLN